MTTSDYSSAIDFDDAYRFCSIDSFRFTASDYNKYLVESSPSQNPSRDRFAPLQTNGTQSTVLKRTNTDSYISYDIKKAASVSVSSSDNIQSFASYGMLIKGSVHQILDAHFHYVQGVSWDPLNKYAASFSSVEGQIGFHKVAKMFNILNPNIQVKRTPGKKSTKIATSDFWQDVRA
ncbi:hypothetical protein L2E82_42272 [Cichorium intybus]|uniref:Uncharacterized protein n=1 Tax=Cichorium intybus TaxID=13427 RepID=A0ACB8ZM31_CICIN|nr:hypothetical protein L2E82_42272 [Cichorium intybus]